MIKAGFTLCASRVGKNMKIGDCIVRPEWMDKDHQCGIVIGFDVDGDPIILWNSEIIEEEYEWKVEVQE